MDSTDDATATMSMTFDSWSVYKLKLLFDGWDVQTQWEFGLTCLAVGLAAVIYQAMRFLIFVVEDTMHPQSLSSFSTLDSVMDSSTRHGGGDKGSAVTNPANRTDPQTGYQRASPSDDTAPLSSTSSGSSDRYIWLRLLHSVLAGLNYGLALVLMLIAMSYNPSILVSLISGYAIGDFIFFVRMRPTGNENCH